MDEKNIIDGTVNSEEEVTKKGIFSRIGGCIAEHKKLALAIGGSIAGAIFVAVKIKNSGSIDTTDMETANALLDNVKDDVNTIEF